MSALSETEHGPRRYASDWVDDKIMPHARRMVLAGDDPRTAAVQAVDGHYGFTMEFSSAPGCHRGLYDAVEERLLGKE